MMFSEVYHLYASCLDGDSHRREAHIEETGKNARELDVMLSPEIERLDVALSLLESNELQLLQHCKDRAIAEIRTHRLGWKGRCGCFNLYWYSKPHPT